MCSVYYTYADSGCDLDTERNPGWRMMSPSEAILPLVKIALGKPCAFVVSVRVGPVTRSRGTGRSGDPLAEAQAPLDVMRSARAPTGHAIASPVAPTPANAALIKAIGGGWPASKPD
jgi:hypothetical protein